MDVVAVDRPSPVRVAVHRVADDLPALLLVLTPIALLNVLVGIRPAGPPGPAEAQAVVSATLGSPMAISDAGFLGQLAVAQAMAGATWDTGLLQSGRGLCLLAGLLSTALLWPALRRIGLGGNAAATALIVAGLGPLALRLQPTVDPGALAACWIALAAAIGYRARPATAGRVAVIALLVAAAITTPLAAAGVLAWAAHALAGGALAGRLRPASRRTLTILAVAAAAGALGAELLRGSGTVPGVAAVSTGTLVAVLVLASPVLVRAARSRPGLRPLVTLIIVWLGAAVLPGPARLTALLLAVPALALLVGARIGDAAADSWPRFSLAAATAVTVTLVSGLVTVLWPVAPPASSSYQPLARWLTGELDQRVVLSAAPLDRAELIAAGVPAVRFAVDSVPTGAVTVVPADAGCGQVGAPVAQMASVAGVLSVCAPPAPANDLRLTPGTGPLLAGNTALRIAEPARRLLLDDRVDSRLVTVLAGAAMTHLVEVIAFPPMPGEPPDAPRRTAVLGGVIPAFDVDGQPAASSLELYLNAQQPPFRPDLRTLPDGRLVVHFRLAGAYPAAPG